jgi:hypothetical protein
VFSVVAKVSNSREDDVHCPFKRSGQGIPLIRISGGGLRDQHKKHKLVKIVGIRHLLSVFMQGYLGS